MRCTNRLVQVEPLQRAAASLFGCLLHEQLLGVGEQRPEHRSAALIEAIEGGLHARLRSSVDGRACLDEEGLRHRGVAGGPLPRSAHHGRPRVLRPVERPHEAAERLV